MKLCTLEYSDSPFLRVVNLQLLERLIRIKEKEQIFIKKTIEYLIKNDFLIKNADGSKFNMQEFLNLHEKCFHENCNGKGQPIWLKVLDADHSNGFISFMPSNGYCTVIVDHSDHLTQYIRSVFMQ